jgi:hypothetical protein
MADNRKTRRPEFHPADVALQRRRKSPTALEWVKAVRSLLYAVAAFVAAVTGLVVQVFRH